MKRRWLFALGAAAGVGAVSAAVARKRRDAARLAERGRKLAEASAERGKNIVILGAGFGGFNTASALVAALPPESGWKVTLVDRHNYHLFTPLLYHAATGLVEPSHILFPVRTLAHAPHFQFREADIRSIDLKERQVHLDNGPLSYDILVLALGSVTNFFGKEAELENVLTLKTTGDAVAIRNRIIDAFEDAESAADPMERRRCLTFVVVGGGATGVELVGAIRGLTRDTMGRQYPSIDPAEVRLLLLEAMPQILAGVDPEFGQTALERLRQAGVEVRLGSAVERVDADGVLTSDGDVIPSRTVIWTAGVKPAPVVERLDVPKIRGGRITVDPFLGVPGFRGVYALGDVAASIDPKTGKPLPTSAAVAVQQAKALAEILVARLEDQDPLPFRYIHRGELVSLGRHEAVADVMGVRLTGFPAWLMWRGFYLSQLFGFKNQLGVALDWTFAYMYQRDTVRMDLPTEPSHQRPLAEPAAGS